MMAAMTDPVQHKLFEEFRPVCVRLMTEPGQDNVATLLKKIRSTDCSQMAPELQEYVLFPLRLILKQNSNHKQQEFLTIVVNCTSEIFSRITIGRWELFQDCFTSICIFMSSPEHRVAPVSEEMKLAVVKCLSALTKNATKEVLRQVYKPAFMPALGHAVSLLLHLVENEKMRELKIASISCLVDVTGLNGKVKKIQVADTIAAFLPGISMSMTKVATGDSKQGHVITKSAIEAWKLAVCVVLGDENLKSITSGTASNKDDQPYQKLVVNRSNEWVTMTVSKLKLLVKKMLPLAGHENWRVRSSMIDWASILLTNCSASMSLCASDFLEVLVSRVGDSYPSVSKASKEALIEYQKSGNIRSLVELLEENLHKMATNLPRLIRTTDDDQKQATLCLFSGYLQLLGPHVDSLLSSAPHLERISQALLQIHELDVSGIKIIHEQTSSAMFQGLEVEQNSMQHIRKYFVHFTEDKVIQELSTICCLFGFYGNLDILVDHFLEKFTQSAFHRKEAAVVLMEIVQGIQGHKAEWDLQSLQPKNPVELLPLLKSIVDEYLQPEHWDVVTSNQLHDSLKKVDITSKYSVNQLSSNVLQVCILLEGIGSCTQVLGVTTKHLLMDLLYPVLEKVGDEHAAISNSAFITLTQIATHCGYQSVPELLHENADYLVNSISLRMRHLNQNPKAPVVLKVVLMHSNRDILPLVDDTVLEVLNSLDTYFLENTVLFLRVLYALVESIHKWFPTADTASKETTEKGKMEMEMEQMNLDDVEETKSKIEEISDFFKDYHKNRIAAEDFDDNQSTEQDSDLPEMQDEPDQEKKEVPQHITLVKSVMERCGHLLASPDPRVRLLVLDTIAESTLVLQTTQDEFLPLVHKIWPAFALRFTDEEPLVVIKAFHVLQVLGKGSGDFIRRRITTDVIPKLSKILEKLSQTSTKAGAGYKFSVNCKLQLSILENIGQLVKWTGLAENQLMLVIGSVLPYLSTKQNAVLQDAAVEAFKLFAELDPDILWLILNDLVGIENSKPPHECFKEIKAFGSKARRKEYISNVQQILDML